MIIRRPTPPIRIATAYELEVRAAFKRLGEHLAKRLDTNPSPALKRDAASRWLSITVQTAETINAEEFARLGKTLPRIYAEVDSHNRRELKRVAGVNARGGMPVTQWRDNNIRLIKSVQGEALDRVRTILEEAERDGDHVDAVKKKLVEATGISSSRAELIARDQTLKLNSNLNKARQTAAGISRYTWSTSKDSRVRETHEALDGQVFSWSDPPDTGTGFNHPGEDFQCRCVAIPVLDVLDLEGENPD